MVSDQLKCDVAELSISIVSGLSLAITALFLCVLPLSGEIASGRDFVVYWATGQQLIHHANPYDSAAMTQIEHSAGLSSSYGPLMMRNPPWCLPLALPLGFLGLRIGSFLWSLVLLACLVLSIHLLWLMHDRQKPSLYWLGLSFAPSLLCLFMGQTSLFVLLGYVLFLRLHLSHPFLAGAALWLCALKPHLLLVCGVVLLAWVLVSKSYRILAGASAAMAVSCAVQYLIDPAAWIQYSHMMRTSGIENEVIPCISVILRLWISPAKMWIQFLPMALGCVWGLRYFWLRRHTWEWVGDGSLLLLVSIILAPYCWLFDQALAIAALLHGAFRTRSQLLVGVLAAASVSILVTLALGISVPSRFYLWTSPAWLAWYLIAGLSTHGSRAGQLRGQE